MVKAKGGGDVLKICSEVGCIHVSDKGVHRARSMLTCTTMYQAYTCEDGALHSQSTKRTRMNKAR
jgi:hypothetical protein